MPPPHPAFKECRDCNKTLPDSEFVHKIKPLERVQKCFSCRDKLAAATARSRNVPKTISAASAAPKRTANAVLSPQRRESPHQPVTPVRGQPQFHRRGINSQESPGTAAAHAEQARIRRDHRPKKRAGESYTPTPTTSQLQPRPNDEGDEPFICGECSIARPLNLRDQHTGLCAYCVSTAPDSDGDELQQCLTCRRDLPREQFLLSGEEYAQCPSCRPLPSLPPSSMPS
ncbi:hypothetical protein EDB80DRAFT_830397 [Ilyonectria destructans]|nr:hypothetical protein EDB80DRAFT_830397 [Ilyonectria destructans]